MMNEVFDRHLKPHGGALIISEGFGHNSEATGGRPLLQMRVDTSRKDGQTNEETSCCVYDTETLRRWSQKIELLEAVSSVEITPHRPLNASSFLRTQPYSDLLVPTQRCNNLIEGTFLKSRICNLLLLRVLSTREHVRSEKIPPLYAHVGQWSFLP